LISPPAGRRGAESTIAGVPPTWIISMAVLILCLLASIVIGAVKLI
jgi:hypothetical protein